MLHLNRLQAWNFEDSSRELLEGWSSRGDANRVGEAVWSLVLSGRAGTFPAKRKKGGRGSLPSSGQAGVNR